jgi:sugar lactone lactonase YvrE
MELIFYAGSSLLEGPVWDSKNKKVYCVSIEQGVIYRIDPKSGEVNSYLTEGSVGCIDLTENGNIISSEKNGIFEINPVTGKRTSLTQLEHNKDLRYNDGKFDPIGRFIVGTKSEKDFFVEESIEKGRLYSYYKGTTKVLLENLLISNGIGFSKDTKKMYFIDTPTKKVAQYFYDLNTGDIVFEKYIIDIDGPGWPDGMCVDLDGNIWVAEWEGSRIRKWNVQNGEVMSEIKLPCSRVTSCCLGGENLDEIYITTAKNDKDILGGALFRKKLI